MSNHDEKPEDDTEVHTVPCAGCGTPSVDEYCDYCERERRMGGHIDSAGYVSPWNPELMQ